MAYKKLTDKAYQIELDGKWTDVFVPFGKIQMLVACFAGNGGMIDPTTGEIRTDLMTLIAQFGELGDIVLSEFDENGKQTKEVSCKGLAHTDVISLFLMVQEILANFIQAISATKQEIANQTEEKAE